MHTHINKLTITGFPSHHSLIIEKKMVLKMIRLKLKLDTDDHFKLYQQNNKCILPLTCQ